MDALLQDLKFSLRHLWTDKGFLATAVLTLALCIGANATIFAVVENVILRPLPVPEPGRLVRMWNAYPKAVSSARGSNGAPDYFDRRALTEVFDEVAAYDTTSRTVELDGRPERLLTMRATPSFFPLVGAEARIGRTFTEGEGRYGNHRVVVLSHGLWQRISGGDRSIVGETLRVDGEPHAVVGVMPEGFGFLSGSARMWTALAFTEEQKQSYHSNSWQMIARLNPGVTIEQAQSRVDALNRRNMEKFPEIEPLLVSAGFHTPVVPLGEDMVRDVKGTLYMLWGGVAFVLLIGCVNIANLLLVRSTSRTRELATRFALGAGRRRVVQQLVTESALLTVVGAALGLAVAWGGLQLLGSMGVDRLPRSAGIAMDGMAVAFTGGLALLVTVVISLIPVGHVLGLSLASVFREEGRSGTGGRGVRVLRKGLVVGQVALALILLMGGGLLLASFQQLLAVDPGFAPEGVLTGSVALPEASYDEPEVRSFAERSLRRIRALPGVEEAGITSQIPFGSGFSDSVIFAEGHVMEPGESPISPSQAVVTPGYFEAMGIPVVRGRTFDERDTADSEPVIVIDRRLAETFWPEGTALGKRMWQPTSVDDIRNPENRDTYRIVGIVESVRERGLAEDRGLGTGAYYFPLAQRSRRGLDFAVRTSGDTEAVVGSIREVLRDLDPRLPLYDVMTMEERISESVSDRRTPMLLAVVFGVLALILAAVGIYGVFAYNVSVRAKEIGIRIALGSDAGGIFRLVVGEGMTILAIGLALGFGGAFVLRRFIESQLYGVGTLDPVVAGTVVAVLGVVALVACILPAREATRIDPVEALTQE